MTKLLVVLILFQAGKVHSHGPNLLIAYFSLKRGHARIGFLCFRIADVGHQPIGIVIAANSGQIGTASPHAGTSANAMASGAVFLENLFAGGVLVGPFSRRLGLS